MEFIVGSCGHISIRFQDLPPEEAARLVGGIIGQVYDLTKQKKVTVDIYSTCLPAKPADGWNKQD